MKIKRTNKSYSEVIKLPKGEHKLPVKPNFFMKKLVNVIGSSELKDVGFSYTEVDMDKAGDGPWLILMNHSSFIDLSIASKILYPRPYNIVCTSDGFIGKEWLMRSIGCIPTQKFVTDLKLISDMQYATEHGSSILLYPEASYSFDGTATRLPRRMGVLFKKLGVPVVMITTYGAFARDPLYNNLQKRNVKVTAQIKCIVSTEDYKTKSTREIDAILDEAFSFDYFKWQKDNNVIVDEPFRADGLHRILYKCPACKTEGQTLGKGITLTCNACGKVWEMDTLGQMKAKDGETEYSHIPDWYKWERECVKEEVIEGTYSLDADVEIGMIVDFKSVYMVGTGHLHHDVKGFTLKGCDGQLDYSQGPLTCYSLYADYFWYEIGDIICIGDKECLYYCFVKPGVNVAKARIATEEIFRHIKEQRKTDAQ